MLSLLLSYLHRARIGVQSPWGRFEPIPYIFWPPRGLCAIATCERSLFAARLGTLPSVALAEMQYHATVTIQALADRDESEEETSRA